MVKICVNNLNVQCSQHEPVPKCNLRSNPNPALPTSEEKHDTGKAKGQHVEICSDERVEQDGLHLKVKLNAIPLEASTGP
jgi:hypothetical protein